MNDNSIILSALRPWQLRIVRLVAAGLTCQEAARRCRVSSDTINRERKVESAFSKALSMAEAGVALQGTDHVRAQAMAFIGAALDADGEDALKGRHWRERRGSRDALYGVAGILQDTSSANIMTVGQMVLLIAKEGLPQGSSQNEAVRETTLTKAQEES